MKLTKGQQKEANIVLFFTPQGINASPTEQDFKEFFDYSDRGHRSFRVVRTANFNLRPPDGLDALIWGKQRRDMHVKLYKECNREGTFLRQDLEEFPEPVRSYVEKRVFP